MRRFVRESDQTLIKLMDLPETQDGVYSTNPLLVPPPEHSNDYHSKDTDIWATPEAFPGIPYGQPWWHTYTKAELDDLLGIPNSHNRNDQGANVRESSSDAANKKWVAARRRRRERSSHPQ